MLKTLEIRLGGELLLKTLKISLGGELLLETLKVGLGRKSIRQSEDIGLRGEHATGVGEFRFHDLQNSARLGWRQVGFLQEIEFGRLH
jgi:hypothetical protein